MIVKKKIIPAEINFLNYNDCLYSTDFRTISENKNYKIFAMWKYENLCPWMLKDKYVVVNEESSNLKYSESNHLIVAKKSHDPRTSIYKRYSKIDPNKRINRVWVAIPHPDADQYCQSNNLKINYSFENFLKLNNKIIQKKILKNHTPEWETVKSENNLELLKKNNRQGYIKRKYGSGGYAVFKITNLNNEFDVLFKQNPEDWFFERKINGRSCSIQCIKDELGNIVIFGFSEQIIEQGRFYSGSKIFSLDSLKDGIYEQLKVCLELLNKLLKDYVGFFGLDFIITDQETVFVLEMNVRLTAVTIPTLLFNKASGNEALYKEDIKLSDISESDLILTQGAKDTGDVLSFNF